MVRRPLLELGRNPAKSTASAIALYYEDPTAAATWLQTTFGLEPSSLLPADDNHPAWNELRAGTSVVLLFEQNERPTGPRPVDHAVWVYVDDLDAHYARSTANGATIVSEITHHGYRSYTATDPESHHWTFLQSTPTS